MFQNMVKQVAREMMMVMLVIAPVLIGLVIKIGIPLLERKVLANYGWGEILVPYYELISWLFAMVLGMLFAFVGGLVVLGEIDDHITGYIAVTPAGTYGYFISRIVIPAVLSGVVALFAIPIFSLCTVPFKTLLVMVVFNVLSGIVTAFLVIAISANKVEGMAVGKLSGLFAVTFFIPLLIKGWIKYIFWIFPMYHVGMWTMDGRGMHLVFASILFAGCIGVLYSRFKRKIQ